ncbi:MAG: sigma-70 family RNA polymerase sigma factor [Lachnospiraceae bacterium]|nr:sigma-70 family RNA polymerase sigma factor [Lachnospiraceae bacterium]
MLLTAEQQRKVEDNVGLVHRVIHDRLHVPYQIGIFGYDDFFQIGCIGLCKAAVTDKGGTFSTYAYRLIWNEICDALISATRRQVKEFACDELPYIPAEQEFSEEQVNVRTDLEQVLKQAKAEAPPSTVKGIEAMKLMAEGYTSREIGEQMGASDKLVCAWVSKARKFLRNQPEAKALAAAYHIVL